MSKSRNQDQTAGRDPCTTAMSRIQNQDKDAVYRVPPYFYLHVRDRTSNVTRTEVGPLTFIRKDNEEVVDGPSKMVLVPPRHYCVVKNPVLRDEETGEVLVDKLGQVRMEHGETEIRLAQEPFPLYPGEEAGPVMPLVVVPAMKALRIRVKREFGDGGVNRVAGDEYLFEGPGTYVPRKEVEVAETISAVVVTANEALKMRATRNTVDRDGVSRVAGEEWLVRKVGPYLPGTYEEVVEMYKAHVLTEKTAVHVFAKRSIVDQTGKARKTGEEYLVSPNDMESFIPGVYEEVRGVVSIITLTHLQYCVVLNPVGEDGKPRLGFGKVVRGEESFFLQPGEQLRNGIEGIYILEDDEGLVIKAMVAHEDTTVEPAVKRKPGDFWMLKGPMEYTPTIEVEVVERRKAIPLHENEGIYVRNTKTGSVRAVVGQTYMLGEHEELWEKRMSTVMKSLLDKYRDACADRGQYINPEKEKRKAKATTTEEEPLLTDDTRVVTFQVPNNAAVQIYDYRSKHSRVVFGPDLVMLEPNEEFTQLSLSGGKPKRPNLIRSLALLLGPDYCSDVITVETSDHACLQLQLSYNWFFDVDKASNEEAAKLFCVNDFVGDMCKAVASRIRGAVSSVSFDDFHKNSAKIIKVAVFGVSEEGKTPNKELRFVANNCVVTSIDVRSVEPVDQKTRDCLQKSVTLAIQITTQSQEATAKREAERVDQEARGRLERQKINDDAEAEKARRELLQLQALSAAVESTGQAKAEAQSRAESMRIEAESAVEASRLKVAAAKIEADNDLERLVKARDAELAYMREQYVLEKEKADHLAEIEVKKFKSMVEAIGSDTIATIASAPQNHQVKLLQSLGLSSTLITDGRTPINLLNTAQGLLGNIAPSGLAAMGGTNQ